MHISSVIVSRKVLIASKNDARNKHHLKVDSSLLMRSQKSPRMLNSMHILYECEIIAVRREDRRRILISFVHGTECQNAMFDRGLAVAQLQHCPTPELRVEELSPHRQSSCLEVSK